MRASASRLGLGHREISRASALSTSEKSFNTMSAPCVARSWTVQRPVLQRVVNRVRGRAGQHQLGVERAVSVADHVVLRRQPRLCGGFQQLGRWSKSRPFCTTKVPCYPTKVTKRQSPTRLSKVLVHCTEITFYYWPKTLIFAMPDMGVKTPL